MKEISVQRLTEKLDRNEKFRFVDCREEDEYGFCKIPGAELIPLSNFAEKALQVLKPDEEIVIHCHHGGRSMRACQFLESQGYQNTVNVTGGIEAWSLQIDPQVPRY